MLVWPATGTPFSPYVHPCFESSKKPTILPGGWQHPPGRIMTATRDIGARSGATRSGRHAALVIVWIFGSWRLPRFSEIRRVYVARVADSGRRRHAHGSPPRPAPRFVPTRMNADRQHGRFSAGGNARGARRSGCARFGRATTDWNRRWPRGRSISPAEACQQAVSPSAKTLYGAPCSVPTILYYLQYIKGLLGRRAFGGCFDAVCFHPG